MCLPAGGSALTRKRWLPPHVGEQPPASTAASLLDGTVRAPTLRIHARGSALAGRQRGELRFSG
jgi:hypothetical protein